MNRRHFLSSTAAVSLGSPGLFSMAGETGEIIDIHQHVNYHGRRNADPPSLRRQDAGGAWGQCPQQGGVVRRHPVPGHRGIGGTGEMDL